MTYSINELNSLSISPKIIMKIMMAYGLSML